MRVLLHKDLELRRVRGSFDKIRAAIEADDFRTADVKKLHAGPDAYRLPTPLVLVGSAGSGKTAVTLAKLREAPRSGRPCTCCRRTTAIRAA